MNLNLEVVKSRLEAIKADNGLTDFQKKLRSGEIYSSLKKEVAVLRSDLGAREIEIREHQAKIKELTHLGECLDELHAWMNGLDPVLEKNDCSRFHKLMQYEQENKLIDGNTGFLAPFGSNVILKPDHTFVVKHNWATAFSKADEVFGDDFVLPYEHCAFEFRVSGRTAIIVVCQRDIRRVACIFVEFGGYWMVCDERESNDSKLGQFLWQQVRSICVALDAEVATHEVQRAPHKLNEKRVKNGLPPLLDYHVVDLAKRHRINAGMSSHEGTQKRLHFRRGHWRHFETSKTWVRWTLVGNPELGFIAKHYTL